MQEQLRTLPGQDAPLIRPPVAGRDTATTSATGAARGAPQQLPTTARPQWAAQGTGSIEHIPAQSRSLAAVECGLPLRSWRGVARERRGGPGGRGRFGVSGRCNEILGVGRQAARGAGAEAKELALFWSQGNIREVVRAAEEQEDDASNIPQEEHPECPESIGGVVPKHRREYGREKDRHLTLLY